MEHKRPGTWCYSIGGSFNHQASVVVASLRALFARQGRRLHRLRQRRNRRSRGFWRSLARGGGWMAGPPSGAPRSLLSPPLASANRRHQPPVTHCRPIPSKRLPVMGHVHSNTPSLQGAQPLVSSAVECCSAMLFARSEPSIGRAFGRTLMAWSGKACCRMQHARLTVVVAARAAAAAGAAGAANGAEPGNRPGQKSGKVVFGSTGNRLLDKKLATEKPKPPAPKPEVCPTLFLCAYTRLR